MSARVVQNFRGSRALIVHRADAHRERLGASLQRLGLVVRAIGTEELDESFPIEDYDALFFDADEDLCAFADDPAAADTTAWIALIGLEAPGRLANVVRRGCCGYLMKPIRAAGVYTALLVGMNEHHRRRRIALECARLNERVQGRRVVTKAVLQLMRAHGIDDDEAYRRLRESSMRHRTSIEELARRCVAATPDDEELEPTVNRRQT